MSTSAHVFPERTPSIHAQARASGIPVHDNKGIKVVADCVIHQTAAELYSFCRKPENLPQILDYAVSITPVEGRASYWTMSATNAKGRRIEWVTIIINDEPGRLIAWQSLEGAPVPYAGTIRFEPVGGEGGTKVTVQVEFDPPSKLAGLFSGLVGKRTKHHVEEGLRRFKERMEKA